MSRAMMTFIISMVVIAVFATLLGFGKVSDAVAVGAIMTIVGYWIRDAQDKIAGGEPLAFVSGVVEKTAEPVNEQTEPLPAIPEAPPQEAPAP